MKEKKTNIELNINTQVLTNDSHLYILRTVRVHY